ncbi:hypothetical protein ACQ4M4_23180 [Leptolyngbya sp. AN02str]|uniref:hypothetical protein n=1 Tax=Leptolyngbya sp. AN02str TaxID=3423363 RepID=UPI003D319191
MSIHVEGTVQKSTMGAGTWALIGSNGQTYELHQGAPDDLLKDGLKVKVEGKIREDVMTIAMIGPVLEVQKFEQQ